MRRMLYARHSLGGVSKRFLHTKPFSTNNKPTSTTTPSNSNNSDKADDGSSSVSSYNEAYRQLDKLDFMTATKILFTTPPKTKKFGIDFHLVQLVFALLPSFAVYLVAQYARYEMRRMEAELELKKQAEEAAKAKEIELSSSEEKEAESDPKLVEVKVRLEKLEEAVKEIVVESKKQRDSTSTKTKEDGSEKRNHAATDYSTTQSSQEASNSVAKDHYSEQISKSLGPSSSQPVTDASQQDSKGTQNGGSAKK